MKTLSKENQIMVDELFEKYKKLASQVGLVDKEGNFFYDSNTDEPNLIVQDGEIGDRARASLRKTSEEEAVIYDQMEAIRMKIDQINKTERVSPETK